LRLSPGARIGVYEVLGFLGAGGMGEVYRARDTKLGRDVALKILPPALTADANRVARFKREARLLASLNHPHIGAIYGFEDAGDVPALVLELVEGDTLADRLALGPLPPAEAVAVAQQIADALDAAHGSGIIHRDLKPANIKVTPDGAVKVLDFGLAKAQTEEEAAPDLSKSPTVTAGWTAAGVILGTVAYMSPEQARGKDLDKRTDIWAFGCVLYEMLTGRLAFRGETVSDTVVAILERDTDWTVLPPATPPAVRRLLRHCLEKDPRRRLRDIGDVRRWIEDVATGEAGAAAAFPNPRRRRLAWLLGAVALASAAGAGWLLRVPPTEAPARSVQLQRLTDFVGMEESPAMSPDGKRVAFVARAGSKRQIWQRLLAGGPPLQITRDDFDHDQPRWTPDSSSLIYFVPSATPGEHGTILEISVNGGEPRRVASALGGGDISHDGRRIALFRFEDKGIALVLVTRDGSGTHEVKQVRPNSQYDYPRWSPDDRWIAFQQDNLAGFNKRVFVVPAAPGGDLQEIAQGADLGGLSWLPSGSGVVYSSSSGSTVLYPPMFNLRAVERDGTGDRQLTFGDVSYREPDVHTSGTLTASRSRMQSDIWRFPVTGSPAENTRGGVRITHQTGQAQTPSVSPDESEVVYLSDSGGHGNLWIARTDGSGVRQITFEQDPAISVGVPVWSPAGNDIVFILTRAGIAGLSLINRDGSGLRRFVPVGIAASWSTDGRWIYYSRSKDDTRCIEKAAIDGGPAISVRCGNAVAPAPTADGSALYFANYLTTTNGIVDYEIRRARPENGPSEVLARVAGSRVPVSRRLFTPVLSPDGKWLTMPLTDGTTSNIWVLPTDGGPMRPLTDFGDRSVVIARRVSWSPDGRHLYAAVAETDADIVLLDGLVR
jgi:Tol biopolymer transport system component